MNLGAKGRRFDTWSAQESTCGGLTIFNEGLRPLRGGWTSWGTYENYFAPRRSNPPWTKQQPAACGPWGPLLLLPFCQPPPLMPPSWVVHSSSHWTALDACLLIMPVLL